LVLNHVTPLCYGYGMNDSDRARLAALDRSLTNQTPSADGIERIEHVRDWAKKLGFVIVDNCQDNRERSLALTHLEDCVMWAVKSIVLTTSHPT